MRPTFLTTFTVGFDYYFTINITLCIVISTLSEVIVYGHLFQSTQKFELNFIGLFSLFIFVLCKVVVAKLEFPSGINKLPSIHYV